MKVRVTRVENRSPKEDDGPESAVELGSGPRVEDQWR